MATFITHLPTWEIIRILGITSYLLLFVGVSLGILYGMPLWKGKQKAQVYKIHSLATIGGTFGGVLHAIFLTIDTYAPFSWKEILIPFTAEDQPFWNGLGTIALYGVLIIILSTDLRNKLKKKLWFAIHLCSYPMFVIALIHGLGSGTDTKLLPVYLMYTVTCGIVLLLVIIRSFVGKKISNTSLADRG